MSMRRITSIVGAVLLTPLAACDRQPSSTSSQSTTNNTSPMAPSTTNNSSTTPTQTTRPSPAADNTDRNKVDRSNDTKTPMDQSESAADIKITAEIRRAIMEDKAMSTNAQNVKIITDKAGVVTLRGVVNSQMEKDTVEAKAKAVAGVSRVDNQLEVKVP